MSPTVMQRLGLVLGAIGIVVMGLGAYGLTDDDDSPTGETAADETPNEPDEIEPTPDDDDGTEAGEDDADDVEEADDSVEEEPESQTAAEFIGLFNDALAADDVDTLLALLHPLVFTVFDQDVCRSYLEGVLDSPPVRLREVVKTEDWEWEVDGQTVTVPDALFVEIERDVNDQTVIQETHYAYEGAELRWFTVCRSPES